VNQEKIFLDVFIKKFRKFNKIFFANYGLRFFAILLILFESGCTTLDLTLPIADLESPRHQGRVTGFGIEYTGASGQSIQLTPDASLRPITAATAKHNVESIFITKPGINIYAWNRFTFTGGLIESKSPFLKMKISLNGFREDDEAGRWHASLGTEVSYQRAEKSGNQNGIGGPSGYAWSGKSDLLNGKIGLSVGYQKLKRLTPFIGYNYQQFQTYGSINQVAAAGDSGGQFSYQPEIGRATSYGFGVDWKLAPTLYIMPQVLYYNLKWYDKEVSGVVGSLKLSFMPVQ
jgi:hypothetical protein